MNKNNSKLLAIGLAILLAASATATAYILFTQNSKSEIIRVACVGDSLTQSSEYPYDLWNLLGNESYWLCNFGAGSTTVSLKSETPYMNTTKFQDTLEFQPDIVIIMLGTNDAQPSLHQYNTSFVSDYVELVAVFQALSSTPQVWIVVPPPIFSNQSGKIDTSFFKLTIIPLIEETAKQTDLPLIDLYSALSDYSDYFPDGVHPNSLGAELIANKIYQAIMSQK